MKRNRLKMIISAVVLIFLFTACTPIENTDTENNDAAYESIINSLEEDIEALENRNEELEAELLERDKTDENGESVDTEEEVAYSDIFLVMSLEVMEAIKNKDFNNLSNYIGDEGLLFSPYGYVDRDKSVVLTQDEVENLEDDNEERQWGNYDGSGEQIIASFDNYYDEFIYDQDFINPDIIGNNVRIGQGNSLENIHEVFEGAHYVEFHFTGFEEEFEGMDWASLRLVFTQEGDGWKLVAIVHDQWTI